MKTHEVIQLLSWKIVRLCEFVSRQPAGKYCTDFDTFFLFVSSIRSNHNTLLIKCFGSKLRALKRIDKC